MTIIFRVLVGVVCDILGARRGLAFLLFLACPGIVGMMSATAQGCVVGPEVEISCVAAQRAVFRSNRRRFGHHVVAETFLCSCFVATHEQTNLGCCVNL